MAEEEHSDEEVEVEATVEGEAEDEAEEEAEGEAATAEDMVEPFDLPSTVQKLKLYFPSAASTAGVKPALEQMEVGARDVRRGQGGCPERASARALARIWRDIRGERRIRTPPPGPACNECKKIQEKKSISVCAWE